jgi:hypothetical protein
MCLTNDIQPFEVVLHGDFTHVAMAANNLKLKTQSEAGLGWGTPAMLVMQPVTN